MVNGLKYRIVRVIGLNLKSPKLYIQKSQNTYRFIMMKADLLQMPLALS